MSDPEATQRADAHAHDHDSSSAAALTRRVDGLVALLARYKYTTEEEIAETLERFLVGAAPANGARIVARAWLDADFKSRLLADANAAIAELRFDSTHWAPVTLRVVENTAAIHNLIVCTLCSCYPIALLGPSPSWYKSEAYRSRVVREPRKVLRDFGCRINDDVQIKVWDSTAELRYFVLPQRPEGTARFNELQLATCVSRDALIGAALAAPPSIGAAPLLFDS